MDMTGDFLLYNMHEYFANLKNNVHGILNCKKKKKFQLLRGKKCYQVKKQSKIRGKYLQCI